MDQRTVLIICGAGIVSGKEIMTLELAQGLSAKGLHVHVLTSTWGAKSFRSNLEGRGVPFDRLPLGFISMTLTLQCMKWTYGQIQRWPELLSGYKSLLRRIKPGKIIHTNWHHLLLLLPFLDAKRDLFWVHEVFPDKPQYRILFHIFNHFLHNFIPVSKAVAESLRRLGIPDHKIRVIYNGLPDPAIGTERPSAVFKTVRLGIVGQINPDKGHTDLLDAFGQISFQWPNAELHIFGQASNGYGHQLRQQSANLGLDSKVKWHGYVSDRASIFTNLDICIVPSRFEDPLPTVAIEAAGFGLPVVVTQKGGLPEIVQDGITGILVPSNNPAALAAGIQHLLANPDLRLSMGAKARQHMLDNFSQERFVNDFLLLLGVRLAPENRVSESILNPF